MFKIRRDLYTCNALYGQGQKFRLNSSLTEKTECYIYKSQLASAVWKYYFKSENHKRNIYVYIYTLVG